MAIEEVTNYTVVWDMDDRKGYIGLFSGEKFMFGHEYHDPAEFMAVLYMLRNEKPLFYDSENHWVSGGARTEHTTFHADVE